MIYNILYAIHFYENTYTHFPSLYKQMETKILYLEEQKIPDLCAYLFMYISKNFANL